MGYARKPPVRHGEIPYGAECDRGEQVFAYEEGGNCV